MNIKIKKLKLVNFKGVRSLEITDFPDVLNVRGANETGKTTIMDGFLWLFFSKNAQDKKDFNIKTLDENGIAIPRLEHEVSCLIDIDGIEMSFRRVYREKYVKTRGEEFPKFSGHETDYFVNDVPLDQAPYKAKVESVIPEELFRLITNPLYFNTMKWDARRAFLFSITKDIPDSEIAQSKPEFIALMKELTGKNLQEFKMQLASERNNLLKQLKEIPSRVDEANRNMPEEHVLQPIHELIKELEGDIAKIDIQLQDLSKAYDTSNSKNQVKQNEVYALKDKLQAKKHSFYEKNAESFNEQKLSKSNLTGEKNKLQAEIDGLNNLQTIQEKAIQDNELKLGLLRTSWAKIGEEKEPKMPENEAVCPTCKRPFEADDVQVKLEELKSNWLSDKNARFDEINNSGVVLKKENESIENALFQRKENIDSYKTQIDELRKQISEIVIPEQADIVLTKEQATEIEALGLVISKLQEEIKPMERPDTNKLNEDKRNLQGGIDIEKAKLTNATTIEATKKRIAELLEQEQDYAQQVAGLEKKQFVIDGFEKAKVETVTKNINDMFQYVEFKMFKELINGGFEPCCDTLYKGVPFPDLNSAAKIWAGIDIISTISKVRDVYAPIWIDNRESITDIPETKAQIINLIVDPKYKELTFT